MFQIRGKYLSQGSALVYLCELLFLSVFIDIFTDLKKKISILSMYLTKQIGSFYTSLQVQTVRYLNLPVVTSSKYIRKPFPILIVPPALKKNALEISSSLADFVRSVMVTHIYDSRIKPFKVPIQGFLIVCNSQHPLEIKPVAQSTFFATSPICPCVMKSFIHNN